MSVIGIDIGYGYTKSFTTLNEIHRKVVFPTAVSPYALDVSFGMKIPSIKVNGQRFAIGEELVINGLPYDNPMREDFIGSPSYMAIMGYVLSHTGFHGDVMVIGLPPNFYRKELAEELSEEIKKQWFTNEQGKHIHLPQTIKVIPQGAGVFFGYVTKNPEIFEKDVLVVDLGYYTLDIVVFSNGKYVEATSTSFQMGVNKLYDDIRKAFGKTHGTFSKDDESIEELIKYGKYTHGGKEYHLDVTEIVNSFRLMITSTIKRHLGKTVKQIDYIIAGGGGINLFRETMSGINLVDDPQFANAMGFYIYGKQFLNN